MIPQPTASRSVSRATSGDSAVEERASIECLRHHGYASASQIVSKPPSSIARACSRISSSGSIDSCMTPIRKGGDIAPRSYALAFRDLPQCGGEILPRVVDQPEDGLFGGVRVARLDRLHDGEVAAGGPGIRAGARRRVGEDRSQ